MEDSLYPGFILEEAVVTRRTGEHVSIRLQGSREDVWPSPRVVQPYRNRDLKEVQALYWNDGRGNREKIGLRTIGDQGTEQGVIIDLTDDLALERRVDARTRLYDFPCTRPHEYERTFEGGNDEGIPM